MSSLGFDPEIVQDFLTESGELLEQLDQDLVALESAPRDPEMLNKVFRALHTIKGSASFLALTNLVELAHAAESALNAARNGVVVVDRPAMDLLLAAVDVLRKQFDDLRDGRELTKAESPLVAGLAALGEGKAAGAHGGATPEGSVAAVSQPAPAGGASASGDERPLELPDNKASLVEFLIPDLEDSLGKLGSAIDALAGSDAAGRAGAASGLSELGDSLLKSAEFFELPTMAELARRLERVGEAVESLNADSMAQALPRLGAARLLMAAQAAGLRRGVVVDKAVEGLLGSLDAILEGTPLEATRVLRAGADARAALAADGVEFDQAGASAEAGDEGVSAKAEVGEEDHGPGKSAQAASGGGAAQEQTIRVEVSRLETLLNLVGELVLQKNRLGAIARQTGSLDAGANLMERVEQLGEALTLATGQLDRVTGDIQVAVMRTRMQPLDKLFGRYPRLIRDLARKTGKQIALVIEGGDTEVDKSVIEELADPLVHLLRNSADHGVEPPADRRAAGKAEQGTIRLVASHEGSHVLVRIIDDGRGLSRDRIGKRAVERGLATQQQIDQMSDREVWNFIFAPGFSTAEQVTDLSGRGVGMDVVRTNIQKIKGSIELDSAEGKGATVAIKIPLTVAILQAMMVQIGTEVYAVPLTSIVEIVKPGPEVLSTIRRSPVMRLRETVLPLIEGCDVFAMPEAKRSATPFALVVEMHGQRAGLMVSGLIGQQEVVIKPIDEMLDHKGPVSGATVRDDGGVSLIVDVGEMIRMAAARGGTGGSGNPAPRIGVVAGGSVKGEKVGATG